MGDENGDGISSLIWSVIVPLVFTSIGDDKEGSVVFVSNRSGSVEDWVSFINVSSVDDDVIKFSLIEFPIEKSI